MLAVIAHAHQRSHRHRAARTLQPPGQNLEQRRLAATVMADQRDALPAVDGKRQGGPQAHAVGEGKGEIGHGKDRLVRLGRFRPLEAQFLALGFRAEAFQLLFQLLRHLLTRSGLPSLGRLGPETAYEIHLALDFGAQALGFTLPLLLKLLLQLHKLAECGLAENGLGTAQIENMRADAVHEDAIVGDEDQGARVVHQKIFQPFHGFNVEMVRGFVEKKDVRPGHQHTGELGALAPAAGKLTNGEMPFLLVKAEPRQHGLRLVFRVITVHGFQFRLTRPQPDQRRFVLGGSRGFPTGPEIMPVRQDIHDPFQERRVEDGFVQILLDVAHPTAAGHDDAPGVGGVHVGQHTDERGFTAPVGPADAQTYPRVDIQREVGKNVPPAERFGKILYRYFHDFPNMPVG